MVASHEFEFVAISLSLFSKFSIFGLLDFFCICYFYSKLEGIDGVLQEYTLFNFHINSLIFSKRCLPSDKLFLTEIPQNLWHAPLKSNSFLIILFSTRREGLKLISKSPWFPRLLLRGNFELCPICFDIATRPLILQVSIQPSLPWGDLSHYSLWGSVSPNSPFLASWISFKIIFFPL